jgi:uncharacterized protein DUF6636
VKLASTLVIAMALMLSAGATQASALSFFQSPSENIGCAIGKRSGVRCDIRERDWRPPARPPSCQLDWGNGLVVGRRGRGHFTCAGDTTLGQGPHLGYGESIRRGRFRCVSRRSGMRCVNRRNGHGFSLSRQRARRF